MPMPRFISFVAALIFAGLWVSAPALAGPKVIGYVALSEGVVFLAQKGGAEAAPGPAQAIFEGDRLRTGEDGKVKVLFLDDSVITMGPRTEVNLSRFQIDEERNERKGLFEVLAGKVRVLVSRVYSGGSSEFEVTVGTAIAGVRGTEFVVERGEDGDRLTTLDGELEVWNKGEKAAARPLGAGKQADSLAGESLAVADVPDSRIDELRDQTEVGARPRAVAMMAPRLAADEIPGMPEAVVQGGSASFGNAALREAGGSDGAGEPTSDGGGEPNPGMGSDDGGGGFSGAPEITDGTGDGGIGREGSAGQRTPVRFLLRLNRREGSQ